MPRHSTRSRASRKAPRSSLLFAGAAGAASATALSTFCAFSAEASIVAGLVPLGGGLLVVLALSILGAVLREAEDANGALGRVRGLEQADPVRKAVVR